MALPPPDSDPAGILRDILESQFPPDQIDYEMLNYWSRFLQRPRSEMIAFLNGARYFPRPPRMERFSLVTGRQTPAPADRVPKIVRIKATDLCAKHVQPAPQKPPNPLI